MKRPFVRRLVSVLLIVLFSFCALSVVGSVVAFRVLFQRTDNLDSVVTLRYSRIDNKRYPRQEISFLTGCAAIFTARAARA